MTDGTIENWSPMPPDMGPPFPRFLVIYWPWYKEKPVEQVLVVSSCDDIADWEAGPEPAILDTVIKHSGIGSIRQDVPDPTPWFHCREIVSQQYFDVRSWINLNYWHRCTVPSESLFESKFVVFDEMGRTYTWDIIHEADTFEPILIDMQHPQHQPTDEPPDLSKVKLLFRHTPGEAPPFSSWIDFITVSPIPVPPSEVVDGRLVIAYAYWEGLPSWIQIISSNEWPANTAILTKWKVENTGNVAADFRVELMGQTSSIILNPGESDSIELTVSIGDPGSYSYPANLYANDTLVDSFTIAITAVSPIPRKPDYLNGALVGVILYMNPNTGSWSTTRDWYYNMGSAAQFPIKNTGSVRCPVGIDFMGVHEGVWLDPGQSMNWEIGVQASEGTHTYPYQIWVRDPDTGIEYVVEEGSLTITGVYF